MTRTTPRLIRTALMTGTLAAAALGGAACATGSMEAAGTGSGSASQPARGSASASAMTDADIAAVVVAANAIDSEMGQLALARSRNAEVRAFAQQMVTDHNAVNEAAVALVTRLGVTPTENPTSVGLRASAAGTRTRLSAMSGAEFDRAYIANEIAYHQTVLSALGIRAPSSARNAELRATLIGVRPAFVGHLQHAQRIQASLGR